MTDAGSNPQLCFLSYIEYTHSHRILAKSIRGAPEIWRSALTFLASQTGSTKALFFELIEQGLEDMEDYYLAPSVGERVRKRQEPVHSAAESGKTLGLDD